MQILDGKKLAADLLNEVEDKIIKNKLSLGLAIISVGNRKENELFIKNKKRIADELGIRVFHYNFDVQAREETILEKIDTLNHDEKIYGIVVQLPLPKNLNCAKIMNRICVLKDIDGQCCENLGRLFYNQVLFEPCAAKAVMIMLNRYNIDVEAKFVVVLGRSTLVGKPVANMLLNRNANVLVLHSKSKNIEFYLKQADIIIAAVHEANFLKGNMIKDGAVVVDVGTNMIDGHLVGDVEAVSIQKKASYLSLVPGGVGPLTVACLFDNLYKAYEIQEGEDIEH